MLDGLNVNLWAAQWQTWMTFMFGYAPTMGVLTGPLIAFLAVTLAGYAIYYVSTSGGILFGAWTPKVRRANRIQFDGAGTVWGSDRELQELLAFGDYQKVEGKATTQTYVSISDQGEEQSQIRVTRWSGD
jgi:hypothetical protein